MKNMLKSERTTEKKNKSAPRQESENQRPTQSLTQVSHKITKP